MLLTTRKTIAFLSIVSVLISLPNSVWCDKFQHDWISIERTEAPNFEKRVRKFLNNKLDAKHYERITTLFDSIESDISIDLIKAIAWQESRWQQFNPNGSVTKGINYRKNKKGKLYVASIDYGLMQINNKASSLNPDVWDFARIQTDTAYNLKAGIEVLHRKLAYAKQLQQKSDWPRFARRYNLSGLSTIEIAVKAYNSMRYSNDYVDSVNHALRTKPWEKPGLVQAQSRSHFAPQLPKATFKNLKDAPKIQGATSKKILKKPVFLGDQKLE